jgi:hypothetical protein
MKIPVRSLRRNPTFAPGVELLETRLTPAVTFAVQQTFAVGSDPFAPAAADFNGDGRPDLVVSNNGGSNLSVLFNQTTAGAATPAFTTQIPYAAGGAPFIVAAADFNGDGRPDLVAVDTNSNSVSVLLNTANGGAALPNFGAQQTFAVENSPDELVVADFNGDGRPDLAVANSGGGTVTVLLNTTPAGSNTVSFAAPQTFAAGTDPEGIAAADLNGDGRPDLVVTNGSTNSLSVLLNTTAAGAAMAAFAARQTFATPTHPFSIVVADFNGDGRPDLAVGNIGSNSVSVWLDTTAPGSQTVNLATQQTFGVAGFPYGVTAGDFDGDGRPDLAVTNYNNNTVSVLLNTTAAGAATPSFAAPQTFATAQSPTQVTAADLNGDGRADLIVVAQGAGAVSVLLNTTTSAATTTPVVVGQFGTTGVWEYNRTVNAWVQLTGANSTLLAADSQGDVVGDFPGNGVWEYRPATGWQQINGVDASVLAIKGQGLIAASFPGYGVAEYLPAFGWNSLTPSTAYLLALDAHGDLAGAFHGYGIQFYRPASGWAPLNGVDPSLLTLDPQGDVFANFHGVGVAEYRAASGWQVLNGVEATALTVDHNGDVMAEFPGYGVGEYLPAAGWHTSTLANAALLGADALGAIFGDFAGAGVWEYDPAVGWHQVRTQDASLLAVA